MAEQQEIGFVIGVQGRIAFVDGLPTVQVGELVETENNGLGYVGAILPERVEVYLLSTVDLEPGQAVRRKGEYLQLAVGDFLLGRVIDPIGRSLDGEVVPAKKASEMSSVRIDQPAVGIGGRRFITEQFDTGITLIDSVFPIGKGQRELILGESRSGKSSFLIDLVANQKGTGVVCVYVLIGKPLNEARDVCSRLAQAGLLEQTVVVTSVSLDPAPLIVLAPAAGISVAEFFQRQGKDVLIILDDMGAHARNYREMSLVSGRAPGRESYPGDIFYQQAKIMERAGCFSKEAGGGSITALPVMELSLADFSGFIPTNLMGMTDGHLLFKAGLAQQGKRPAIDLFFSVTRVGSQTQQRVQNMLSMRIKQVLARGAELEVVSRFGSELPFETQQILRQKEQIEELLIQEELVRVPLDSQVILLSLPFTKFLAGKDGVFVKNNIKKILAGLETEESLKSARKEVFAKKDLEELLSFLNTLTPVFEKMVVS